MARPKKSTVDYFPHFTEHGKTMFVLESKWGNDGYATWFKILEKLGSADGHYLDCREEISLTFLAAYCRISDELFLEIVNTLAYLHAIDRDLWRRKVIFCQHFIDGVKDAYRKRLDNFPTREKVFIALKLSETEFPAEETLLNKVSDAGSTERERERERENKNLSASDDAVSEYWLSKKKRKLEGKRLEAFKKFWTAFNYPKGRAEAIDSWLDIPEMTAKLVDTIIAAATREATERPQQQLSGKTPKMAQGWLTARRWEDGQIQSEAKPTIDPRYSQAFQRLQ